MKSSDPEKKGEGWASGYGLEDGTGDEQLLECRRLDLESNHSTLASPHSKELRIGKLRCEVEAKLAIDEKISCSPDIERIPRFQGGR